MKFEFTIHHDVYLHAPPDVIEFLIDIKRNQRDIMAKVDEVLTTLEAVAGDLTEAIDALEAAVTVSRDNLSLEQQERFDAVMERFHKARDDARDGIDEAKTSPDGGETQP